MQAYRQGKRAPHNAKHTKLARLLRCSISGILATFFSTPIRRVGKRAPINLTEARKVSARLPTIPPRTNKNRVKK